MNIIVAEDEAMALEEIKLLLEPYLSDYRVHPVSDAFKALELCRKVRPDLLITDIRMPRMDGLELIAALKPQFPDMAAILISGYDDFAYARQGMQLGVKEYLLKPLKEEALYQAIDRTLLELREDRDKNRRLSDWMLTRELLGQTVEQEERMTEEYGVIVVSALRNRDTADGRMPEGRGERPEGLPSGARIVFPDAQTQCAIIPCPSRESVLHGAADWARGIHEAAKRQCPFVHTTYQVKEAGEALFSAYGHALERIGRQMRLEDSTLTGPLYQAVPADLASVWDKARVLEIYLTKRELRKARDELNAILQELRLRSVTMKDLTVFLTDMLIALQFSLTRSLGSKIAEHHEISAAVGSSVSYAELGDWLERKLAGYVNRLGTSHLDARELVQLLMHRVKHAFEAPDSLQQFAKDHHVSVGYLSRVFKNELGVNFSDYLLEIRMERARALLETGTLSLSDISRRIGYEDPKYFSQLFKKTYGITPSEYGKQKKNSPRNGK
ncbi:response regulator [Cohnella sp.]|uniref:response regulator transcription factor n=1 Tax=Cohnella sp. TaxID=1883426 RepID=UPI003568BC6B